MRLATRLILFPYALPWRALLVALLVLSCSACTHLAYYAQAAHGQLSLLSAARPIDEILADPAIENQLRQRLQKTQQIRRFAINDLGLPDNASYTSYADLSRPFVLWNVVATPELSLQALQWCFPVAGCVNYRGYYSKEDAQAYAAHLHADGYDVHIIGVPTYSTLGWFDDPLLSTFIFYPDGELARLVFHELAHQVIYVKDDTQFNESFATAVEEAGVERWFALHEDAVSRKNYTVFKARKQQFIALLLQCRKALMDSYAASVSDAEKRKHKLEIFARLQHEYQHLKRSWDGYSGYDRWFDEPLSNAHLALIASYHNLVPGFRALLREQGNFTDFYQAVTTLAAENSDERHRQLLLLGADTAIVQDDDTAGISSAN